VFKYINQYYPTTEYVSNSFLNLALEQAMKAQIEGERERERERKEV
jgi:hypothetical protein